MPPLIRIWAASDVPRNCFDSVLLTDYVQSTLFYIKACFFNWLLAAWQNKIRLIVRN